MMITEKVDKVWNAIKSIPRYSYPECIVFFEMNYYTFVLKDDVEKIWKESFEWIKNDHGHIGENKAIRLEKFDPNDMDNYFDDLLYRGYTPIRVNVQTEYWLEKEYVRTEN